MCLSATKGCCYFWFLPVAAHSIHLVLKGLKHLSSVASEGKHTRD